MSATHYYYPFRALKNRPYFTEYLQLPHGERTWADLTQLAMTRTGDTFGRENKADPHAMACRMSETSFSGTLLSFMAGGAPVFHLTDPLLDALSTTELGDATVGDLSMPFETIYVQLGSGRNLTFNNGLARLEGVFLEKRPEIDGNNSIGITLAGELVTPPPHWGERGLETFSMFIAEEKGVASLPLTQAIAKRLSIQGSDPLDDVELSDLDEFDESTKMSIRASWEARAEERALSIANAGVVIECMTMVANALLYISQYPDDAVTKWQEGTPKSLVQKYERSAGKDRLRNLSKARNNGFTLIRKVGKAFEAEQQSTAQGGESPSPHLRRAHWRRQAYGPNNSQRKLIWIRMARVLGGDGRDRPYRVLAQIAQK